MSMIWTQIQFTEDVVDSMQKTEDYAQFERYIKLGTQLTNLICLFNSYVEKDKKLNEISVYETNSYELLLDMITEAKQCSSHTRAFVFGIISHYILDAKTRPYIDHLNRKINCQYINAEAQIDTFIMKKTYNLRTWKTPVYNEINIGMFIDKDIVKLLTQVNHPIANYIQKTYWHLKFALRFYFDPYGWKTKLLPSFQPIYSPHYRSQNWIDYLNIHNNKWFNNITKKPSYDNFFQLYDKAKLEAHIILNEIVNYWTDENIQLSNDVKQMLNLTYHHLPFTRSS